MKIQQGLFPHMVLQRAGDVSDAAIAGTCRASGAMTATVRSADGVLPNFRDVVIGEASKGAFAGRLAGVPVGGPYTVELSIGKEHLTVDDVLVGDVWILGGQSNMQGCGDARQAAAPHPLARAFYMDDRWDVARDPIHNMWACVDQAHIDLCGGARPTKNVTRGVGPGVAFAQEMHRLTGVPQGVLACAHGGTSMAQWDPKLSSPSGSTLYRATLRRVRKNGGRVAGVVWYQGCSDAIPEVTPAYTTAMKTLVKAFRRDCGDATLPFALVQIATVHCWNPDWAAAWNSIQEQQRRLPDLMPRVATVPAIDLSLDDGIHISGEGQQRLGRRLASAMVSLLGLIDTPPAPTLKKIGVEVNPLRGSTDIVVTFDNVVGALRSEGRPKGFAITDSDRDTDIIFRTDLDGSKVILHTNLQPLQAAGKHLHYGFGLAPYCNITDNADRSLPVFGPVPIAPSRALSPFIRSLRVSAVLPLSGKVSALPIPATTGWTPRTFPEDFCNLHPDIAAAGEGRKVVYYACRFTCPEAMKLNVCVGYDGPVKVWLDYAARYTDPNGINPAYADQARIAFAAPAGEHEVIVALDTNHGAAWGIHLRFERQGVSAKKIAAGEFTMPEIQG